MSLRRTIKLGPKGRVRMFPTLTYGDASALCDIRLSGVKSDSAEDAGIRESGDAWAGGSAAEARTWLRTGYQPATDRVKALAEKYAYAARPEPTWENDVSGTRVDPVAYIAGMPDCMLTREDMPVERPRLRLIVPLCYSAGVNADVPIAYSTALATILERLIADGHDVSAVGIDRRSAGSHVGLQAFIIRDWSDPLDVSRIAYAMHPSFLRRVLFMISELSDDSDAGISKAWHCGGYGSGPYDPTEEELAWAYPDRADGVLTIRLPTVESGDKHPEKWLARFAELVKAELDKAGA